MKKYFIIFLWLALGASAQASCPTKNSLEFGVVVTYENSKGVQFYEQRKLLGNGLVAQRSRGAGLTLGKEISYAGFFTHKYCDGFFSGGDSGLSMHEFIQPETIELLNPEIGKTIKIHTTRQNEILKQKWQIKTDYIFLNGEDVTIGNCVYKTLRLKRLKENTLPTGEVRYNDDELTYVPELMMLLDRSLGEIISVRKRRFYEYFSWPFVFNVKKTIPEGVSF